MTTTDPTSARLDRLAADVAHGTYRTSRPALPVEVATMGALGAHGPQTLDGLSKLTRYPTSYLLAALAFLEAEGLVESDGKLPGDATFSRARCVECQAYVATVAQVRRGFCDACWTRGHR